MDERIAIGHTCVQEILNQSTISRYVKIHMYIQCIYLDRIGVGTKAFGVGLIIPLLFKFDSVVNVDY